MGKQYQNQKNKWIEHGKNIQKKEEINFLNEILNQEKELIDEKITYSIEQRILYLQNTNTKIDED